MIRRVHTKPKKVDEFRTIGLLASLKSFPVLAARVAEIQALGWDVYVVDQRRGISDSCKEYITVPLWALTSTNPGYWVYYLAHELAHTYKETWFKQADSHGPKFMERFLELCPVEYQHYELGYKARQATNAGIDHTNAHKAVEIKVIDILDLL